MSKRLSALVLSTAALVGPPCAVLADEPSDLEDGDNTVSTTIPATRELEDPRFPTGYVTEVPLEDVRARGGEGLADALEEVPGVSIRRNSSFGQPAFVQLRGGNPRQVLVLLNGVRVRVPAGLGFDVGSLSLAGLEAVRVYRGPAGVVHGAGALAGAIELDAGGGASDRLFGQVSAGSFGAREILGEYRGAAGAYDVHLGGSFRTATGDFPFVDAQGTSASRVNNDHRRLQGAASVSWAEGRHRLGATALLDDGRHGVAGPSEFQEVFGLARFAESRMITTAEWYTRDVIRSDRAAMDLRAMGGMQWRGNEYRNPDAILGSGGFDNDSTVIQAEGAGEAHLYTPSNFGRVRVEGRVEDYRSVGEGFGVERIDAVRRTAALGVTDEQILAKGRVSVVGAVRVDAIQDEGVDRVLAPAALGAVWRGARWFKLRANVARSARAPDLDELFLNTEVTRGDPELIAERAWVGDVGVDLGGLDPFGAYAQVVGFAQSTDDLIAFVPVSAYLIEARNLSRAVSRGLELSAGVEPWTWLRVQGHYTLTDARFGAQGRRTLPNIPRHRAQVMAQLARTPLRARAGASWRSLVTLDPFGSLVNPGFVDVFLGVGAQVWGGVEVRLDAQNLLDYRRAVDALQRPLPGRTIYATLRSGHRDRRSPGRAGPRRARCKIRRGCCPRSRGSAA
ncbi:MAG: TonB-dependent receptor, partial [Myxococcota bacterium]